MSYSYDVERDKLFTEDGQRMFRTQHTRRGKYWYSLGVRQ